jgi:hypothetical protein
MWAQGLCTPNRQMEGQPECVIALKRPLIDRLIDAVKP